MIKHIVIWTLHNPADAPRMKALLESCRNVVPGILALEAGIRTDGLSQAYLALGEAQGDGAIAVRLYDKPLILLIWIGALVMAAGGALSLTDRRYRLAAPRRTSAPAALPQAAE